MLCDLKKYIQHLEEQKLAQPTIKTYSCYLKRFILFLASRGRDNIHQVTLNDVSQFKEYLQHENFSKISIKSYMLCCRCFLRFLGHKDFPEKVADKFESPLAWALKDFYNYCMFERGFSKNAWNSYERELKRFLTYMSANNLTSFDQINQTNFTQFLSKLYADGLCANSVRRAIAPCKTFFRFLKREGVIKISHIEPIEAPKVWEKQPDLLTEEEIVQIIETPNIKTQKGMRDRSILELLYGSGLRVSELCSLRVIDFDFQEKMIRVFGKGSKERLVPLNGNSVQFVQQYWHKYRPGIGMQSYAFVANQEKSQEPISRVTLWLAIKKYAEKCGITKNIHPHTFRHSFATHMLDNDADIRTIQELMGHSDIGTTGHYLQSCLRRVKEKFAKCHPRKEAAQSDPSSDLSIEISNVITPAEVVKLIESTNVSSEKGIRDRALLELLYHSSGIRIGELCELQFKQFDLSDRAISVNDRIVYFTDSCLYALCSYWLNYRPSIIPDDYAFVIYAKVNNQMNQSICSALITKYIEKCGLKDRKTDPFLFRKCFAEHLIAEGLPKVESQDSETGIA